MSKPNFIVAKYFLISFIYLAVRFSGRGNLSEELGHFVAVEDVFDVAVDVEGHGGGLGMGSSSFRPVVERVRLELSSKHGKSSNTTPSLRRKSGLYSPRRGLRRYTPMKILALRSTE